jgi:hypothetical protein
MNTASNDWVKKIYVLACGIGFLVAVLIIALLAARRGRPARKPAEPVTKDSH